MRFSGLFTDLYELTMATVYFAEGKKNETATFMQNKIIGLFVGKFQPFHNGHLFAIKDVLSQVDQIIIVIGSSQYSNLKNQPFSSSARKQMIEEALINEGIKNFSIVEVPDIHDNDLWVEHLQEYVKNFDVVFTNNPLVRRLFAEKGFKVKSIKMLPEVSGTTIRRKINSGKGDWQTLVPVTTAETIEKHLMEK